MSRIKHGSRGFVLADWTVVPERLVLLGQSEQRKLEPKAMEMLVYLAGRSNEVITREELINEVWRESFGTDEVLSRIISVLRSHLGDDTRNPEYIETIPKVGYRLLVDPVVLSTPVRSVPSRQRKIAAVGVVVAMAVLLAALLFVPPNEPPAATPHTIAILPFRDVSEPRTAPFFAVGLTDELIVNLSRSPDLRVVARRSLGNIDSGAVDYFIEGTVTVFPGRLRVFTELTSGKEDMVVWSETYESQSGDYLDAQRAISTRITQALSRRLGSALTVTTRANVDLEAYTAYLNGIFLTKLRGEEPLLAGAAAFSRALEIQPDFDSARLGLAKTRVLLPYYSDLDEAQMFDSAEEELGKLRNPSAGEADAIRGFMAFRRWQWRLAERFFLSAIEKNPESPNTYVWYSQFLSAVGRNEQAVAVGRQAYDLDSVSPVVNDRLATAYLWMNQNARARERYEAGASFGFNNRINPGYLLLLLRSGEVERAREMLRLMHPDGDIERLLGALDSLGDAGREAELVGLASGVIERNALMPRLELGIWVLLAQWDRVAGTMAKYGHQKKYIDVEFLFSAEAADLHRTEIFAELVSRVGLQDYWDAGYPPDFIEKSS